MFEVEKLWLNIRKNYPTLERNVKSSRFLEALQQIFVGLDLCSASREVHEIFWIELTSLIRGSLVPAFWEKFNVDVEIKDSIFIRSNTSFDVAVRLELFKNFIFAVAELITSFCTLESYINLPDYPTDLEKIENKRLHKIIREILLSQIHPYFNYAVFSFYWVSFEVLTNMNETIKASSGESDIFKFDEVECRGCKNKKNKCRCNCLDEIINGINGALKYMDLLDGIAGESLTSLIQSCIKDHINETCLGTFDKSLLKGLQEWLDDVVIKWLKGIYNNGNPILNEINLKTMDIIKGFEVKLTYFLYEHYARTVIDQLFNIIIDFPDSIPAIDDLRICMEKVDMQQYLITTLSDSLKVRILHPGVNTMDILTGYVTAIKAIRHLDSSGTVLETVTAPIKDYLRKRPDTVRHVVTGLTEEGPTDLSEELAKGEMLKENIGSTSCDELNNWENWMPSPIGFGNSCKHSANTNNMADIISMVVDIYGSKELFMNEYRNLMADRMLTQLDLNPDKEIRNLELLKLRFGESILHSCEVMLKDITDSKRINVHIQNDNIYKESKQFDISTLIISAQFWPSFNKESLELPEEIASEFEKYTKAYEAYKGNRTLNWRTVTGRVDIVVEIGERTFDMTVAPTQAVILYYFQNKGEWTLDDLSYVMKIPSTILRRRIEFWQSQGFIAEINTGVFKLLENVEKPQLEEKRINQLMHGDEDRESPMASASDQREEELQVFWCYIVGMLTNLHSLPIERIHQMLKLFALHGIGVEFTQDELNNFLQRKVREHKLIFSGGVYQLSK